MLTIDALRARIRRLNDLGRGLAKEAHRIETKKDDPLDFMERQAYRTGIRDAAEALEQARIALVKVIQRLDGERR